MHSMFYNCSSLILLNLNNFNTSNVINMGSMFYGCSSLISLNINNFDTSKVTDIAYMFYGCSSLISLNLNNFDTTKITRDGYMHSMFYGCSSLISLNINNFDTSKVTDIAYMFYGCSSLISLNITNFDTSNVKDMESIVERCSPYLIICINEAKANNIMSLLSNFSKDCNNICFTDLNHKLIIEKHKCIDYCSNDDAFKYEYNNICYISCPEGTYISCMNEYFCVDIITYLNQLFSNKECKKDKSITKDDMAKYIKEGILNSDFDDLINQLLNNEKENLLIEDNDIKYEIIINNNYNEFKNLSIIKLGECNNILEEEYNISDNKSLIIFKIDIYKKGLLIPIVEYEVYDYSQKISLELDICKDKIITLLLPCTINEEKGEEFKYNISNEYYNDICYSYTTDDNTDIILSDRRNEFIDNKMTLCENNCEYGGYKSNIKKSVCECKIKTKLSLLTEINTDELLNSLVDINYLTNYKIMICYNKLFSKEGLIKNIGNYTLSSIILFNIIGIIFFIKRKELILLYIKIIKMKVDNINNKLDLESNINKKIMIKKKTSINNIEINNIDKDKEDSNIEGKGKHKFYDKRINKINISKRSNSKLQLMNNNDLIMNIEAIEEKNNNEKIIKKLNDHEINSLSYKEVISIDKRSYIDYYFSLLKRKQMILFTFCITDDYNSKSIKICLFLFSFALCFTVNALFFDDTTMHRIYIDKGKYDFIYEIRNIIYSTLISSIIGVIVKYFSLSENNIIELKNSIDEQKNDRIKTCIKIKIILFFILDFIFLSFFWYYLSCFCAIYTNTQIHLFKSTLITFGLSLLYPTILCLLPGIFRIPSLRAHKQDKECMYKISTIIQKLI